MVVPGVSSDVEDAARGHGAAPLEFPLGRLIPGTSLLSNNGTRSVTVGVVHEDVPPRITRFFRGLAFWALRALLTGLDLVEELERMGMSG